MGNNDGENLSFIKKFKGEMKNKIVPYIDWASIITEKNDEFKNHVHNAKFTNFNNGSDTKSLKDLDLHYLTDNELYKNLNDFSNQKDKYYIAINIINKSNFTNNEINNINTKQALSNVFNEDYLLNDNSIHFLDRQINFLSLNDETDTDYIKIPAFGLDKNIYIDYSLNLDKTSFENLNEIIYEDDFNIDNLLEYLGGKVDDENIKLKINLLSNKTLPIDEQMEGIDEVFDFIENRSIRDKYVLLLKRIINNLNKVLKINTVYSLIIIKKVETITLMKNENLINASSVINASDIKGYFKPSENYFTEFDDTGYISNTRVTLNNIINDYKIPENIYGIIKENISNIKTEMQGNTVQDFLNDLIKSINMEGFENKKTTILNIFICLIFIFLIYQINKSI